MSEWRRAGKETKVGRGWCWLESAAAGACAGLAALTLVTRDWIEQLTGLDPDHASGGVEWALVAAFAVAAIRLSLGARRRWREIDARPLG